MRPLVLILLALAAPAARAGTPVRSDIVRYVARIDTAGPAPRLAVTPRFIGDAGGTTVLDLPHK